MTAWAEDELHAIAAPQEREIAPCGLTASFARPPPSGLPARATTSTSAPPTAPSSGRHHVAQRSGAGRAEYGRYASIVDGITNDQAPGDDTAPPTAVTSRATDDRVDISIVITACCRTMPWDEHRTPR